MMASVRRPTHDRSQAQSKFRSLDDPRVRERIREAEERIRSGGDVGADAVYADELGGLVGDLRIAQRSLEDPEP